MLHGVKQLSQFFISPEVVFCLAFCAGIVYNGGSVHQSFHEVNEHEDGRFRFPEHR